MTSQQRLPDYYADGMRNLIAGLNMRPICRILIRNKPARRILFRGHSSPNVSLSFDASHIHATPHLAHAINYGFRHSSDEYPHPDQPEAGICFLGVYCAHESQKLFPDYGAADPHRSAGKVDHRELSKILSYDGRHHETLIEPGKNPLSSVHMIIVPNLYNFGSQMVEVRWAEEPPINQLLMSRKLKKEDFAKLLSLQIIRMKNYDAQYRGSLIP